MKKHVNPLIKKGDFIILVKSRNGATTIEGKLLEVLTGGVTPSKLNNFNVRCVETGATYSMYNTTPADHYILATRESQAKYLREQNVLLAKQIDENSEKIEFLEKYATEEDFVADKLEAILTAHSKSTSKTARVNAISAILKELKQSNVL